MTFKPRPYVPGEVRAPRSPAQEAALNRNFRIFRLRGLHSQMGLLTGKRREQARNLVDQELAAMGAETEAKRIADREAKYQADWAAHVKAKAEGVLFMVDTILTLVDPEFDEVPS